MKALNIFLSLLVLIPFTVFGQTKTGFNKSRMDSLLTVLETKDKMMGAVSVLQDGKLVYERAIGSASLKENQKVEATPDTKYRVGSISKTFTATLIMQLVEANKLSLDTKLAAFFPQFENASSITVEQLLRHRSGLKSFTTDAAYTTYMTLPKKQSEMLDIMVGMKTSFAPGEKFEYSNTNYVLLGYIVEKATKQPYAQVVKKNIVDKLGLKNTFYGAKINSLKNEASSFKWMNGQWTEMPETDMSIPHGAGGMVSTSQDLALFIQGLFQKKLVSEASLNKMISMQDNFGIGVSLLPLGTDKGYGHGGIIDGFSSIMAYYPEQKLTVAAVSNGVATNFNDVLIGVMSIALDKPYRIPTYVAPKNATLDLAKYEGIYSSTQFPLKITIRKEGDTLIGQATGQSPITLEAESEEKFVFAPAGIVMQFRKSTSGAAYDQFTLLQNGAKLEFIKEQ